MKRISPHDIVLLAGTYAEHRGLSVWRVSALVQNNGGFVRGLENGGGLTLRVYYRCLDWFHENWPDDLDWPVDVPRPVDAATVTLTPNPDARPSVASAPGPEAGVGSGSGSLSSEPPLAEPDLLANADTAPEDRVAPVSWWRRALFWLGEAAGALSLFVGLFAFLFIGWAVQ